ncbi:hypothetical protein J4438_03945 [Candidatus Woesearchaeota archaeon]|nr:hypothetical protein [Candidatus Woesearchaeota archaeon]
MGFFHNKRNSEINNDSALSFSRQGTTTNPQTANQITELGRVLNSGIKNVEVGGIQQEIFEQIPKQHLSEMRRLAKLTGANVSVHAPILDPAGFTQQGWSEQERKESERYMELVLEKAHELNPNGNIPVNFHTTIGVPGTLTEKAKITDKDLTEEERKNFQGEKIILMHAVERDTGKIIPLKREVKEHLDGRKTWTPQELLDNVNKTSWDQEKLQLMSYQKSKEELRHMSDRIRLSPQYASLAFNKKDLNEDEARELAKLESQMMLHQKQIGEYDTHLNSGLNNLYNKYSKYKDPNEKEGSEYIESAKKLAKMSREERDSLMKIHGKIPEKEFGKKYQEWVNNQSNVNEQILSRLSNLPTPNTFVSSEDFAKENSIKTVANVAAYAYKKYGEKAPLLTMENVFPNMVLSRGESLKGLIEESRKLFVKKLVEDQHVNKSKAEKIASNLIGATWDVGHLHHLKKQGYEDKDFIEETKKVAPFVKHVHLTDNFGFTDAHLPLGMGDVPIKEHLKALEKADKNAIHVVESGGFINQFKANPIPQTLEYLNSSMYTYEAGPNWSDSRDLYGSYLVGYGDILPEKHFDTLYGGGFSRLPKELGGQSQGNKSRFAGTPNQ